MSIETSIARLAPLAEGTRFGAYEIEALIGSGGMGEVYRAHDLKLGRAVAIKVLPEIFTADPERRARFDREAHALATLNHPHIGAIYGVEDVGPRRGLILELLAGPTLADRLRRGPIPIAEALTIASQIAGALAAAHEHGIIHRDLKPANIKLTSNGSVKLLDFGLAKRETSDASPDLSQSPTISAHPTEDGVVLGTAAYMSPEQARGHAVDARTDVWALGCVLYEMLAGRSAFGGQTVSDTIAAVLTREPDWTLLPKRTPAPVRDLLKRCLRHDREQRLHAIADARVIIDETLVPPYPLRRWRRLIWAVAGGFSLVSIVGVLTMTGRRAAVPPTLESTPFTTFLGDEAAPAFSPDGTRVAFVWDQGAGADLYVMLVGGSDPLKLTHRPYVNCPSWSPDGRQIAFLRRTRVPGEREVSIVPALGGAERRVATTHTSPNGLGLTWSIDGRHLIVVDKDSPDTFDALFLLSIESGEKRRLTEPGVRDENHPILSPDGRTVALIRHEQNQLVRDVYVMPAAGGEARRLTTMRTLVTGLDWSADGRSIVFAATNARTGRLWRIGVAGGSPEPLPVGEGAGGVAIARTGGRLAYDVVFENTDIWRAAGPATPGHDPPARFIASTRGEWFPTYSPDGSRVLVQSNRTGEFALWICAADGTGCSEVAPIANRLTGPAQWSPDGEWIAFTRPGPQVALMRVDGGIVRPLVDRNLRTLDPVWSPDGRWIYFNVLEDTAAQLWPMWKIPATGGTPSAATPARGRRPRVSEDGRFLYYNKGVPPSPIWRSELATGKESPVVDLAVGSWTLWKNSLLYAVMGVDGHQRIVQLDPVSGRSRDVIALGNARVAGVGQPLDVSPDGRWIIYPVNEQNGGDIMVVENFR